jgi:hypothetical protein
MELLCECAADTKHAPINKTQRISFILSFNLFYQIKPAGDDSWIVSLAPAIGLA